MSNEIIKSAAIRKAILQAFRDAAGKTPGYANREALGIAQSVCDHAGATLEPGSVRVEGDGHAITYSATLPGKIQRAEWPDFKWETVPDDRVRACAVLRGEGMTRFGMSAERIPKELRKLYAEPVEQAWEEIDLGSAQLATGGTTRTPCPDCAHTEHPGQYWGAFEASPCSTCGGTCEVVR